MANHGFSGHRERGLDEVKEHNLVIRSQSKSRRTSTRTISENRRDAAYFTADFSMRSTPPSSAPSHAWPLQIQIHAFEQRHPFRLRHGFCDASLLARRGLPNELVKSPRQR